jgi:hypothetical protein
MVGKGAIVLNTKMFARLPNLAASPSHGMIYALESPQTIFST